MLQFENSAWDCFGLILWFWGFLGFQFKSEGFVLEIGTFLIIDQGVHIVNYYSSKQQSVNTRIYYGTVLCQGENQLDLRQIDYKG